MGSIIEINKRRNYKTETQYIAINIADRYIEYLAKDKPLTPHLTQLACICLFIAAKIEQSANPSIGLIIVSAQS